MCPRVLTLVSLERCWVDSDASLYCPSTLQTVTAGRRCVAVAVFNRLPSDERLPVAVVCLASPH